MLPKFHPGSRAAKAADAVIGVKISVQTVAVDELDEIVDVDEDTDELVLVDKVVAIEVDLLAELGTVVAALELAVPGTH